MITPTATQLEGTIEKILFPKEIKGDETYYIAKFHDETSKSNITIKGYFPGLKIFKNLKLALKGKFQFNEKYKNWDFTVSSFEQKAPTSKFSLATYLKNIFPDLKKDKINRLIDQFGEKLPDILTNDSYKLNGLSYITEEEFFSITSLWNASLAYSKAVLALQKYPLSTNELNRIYQFFNEQTVSIIQKNPYILVDMGSLEFSKCDNIALADGFSPQSEERIRALILYILKDQCFQDGHLYLTFAQLKHALLKFENQTRIPPTKISDSLLKEELLLLHAEEKVVLQKHQQKIIVYPHHSYVAEESSAQKLNKILQQGGLFQTLDIDVWITKFEKANQVTFVEKQKEALKTLLSSRLLLVTGNPGTGKSFLTKSICALLDEIKKTYILLSPTGLAAKKLNTITGHQSGTIHRILKWGGIENEWGFNSIHPYPVEVFIIDEMSMLDQFTFYHLLDAISNNATIIMIGDYDQLHSVGAGSVLRELVLSNKIPLIRLTEIMRQAETSDIIKIAHKINRGEIPTLAEMKMQNDVTFFAEKDETKITETVTKLVNSLKDKNLQVLSPMYKSEIGVNNLNSKLREIINPQLSTKVEYSDEEEGTYRENDTIIVIRNNYNKKIFNGELGTILEINRPKETIILQLHGVSETFTLTFSEAKEYLRLAYCLTVHKAQGNEYEYVILPWSKSFNVMLQRNLLYTAITRAKKKVFIIGDYEAFKIAIENNEVENRNTLLGSRLKR